MSERGYTVISERGECQVCFPAEKIREASKGDEPQASAGEIAARDRLVKARRDHAMYASHRLSPQRVWRVSVYHKGMRVDGEVRACHWHTADEVSPLLRETIRTAKRAMEQEVLNG